MKGHGGDFVDYNDLSMYDGGDFVDLDDLALYTGGAKIKHAHRKAARGAKVGNYRNPIEQAERNAYKRQKQADWLLTEGPAYAAKLRRKAQYINDALVNTDTNDLGRDYNLLYANELQRMSGYAPYSKAALKYNLRPAAPALPAGDQYNAYIAALTRARNRALGIVPQAANLEEIGH